MSGANEPLKQDLILPYEGVNRTKTAMAEESLVMSLWKDPLLAENFGYLNAGVTITLAECGGALTACSSEKKRFGD